MENLHDIFEKLDLTSFQFRQAKATKVDAEKAFMHDPCDTNAKALETAYKECEERLKIVNDVFQKIL